MSSETPRRFVPVDIGRYVSSVVISLEKKKHKANWEIPASEIIRSDAAVSDIARCCESVLSGRDCYSVFHVSCGVKRAFHRAPVGAGPHLARPYMLCESHSRIINLPIYAHASVDVPAVVSAFLLSGTNREGRLAPRTGPDKNPTLEWFSALETRLTAMRCSNLPVVQLTNGTDTQVPDPPHALTSAASGLDNLLSANPPPLSMPSPEGGVSSALVSAPLAVDAAKESCSLHVLSLLDASTRTTTQFVAAPQASTLSSTIGKRHRSALNSEVERSGVESSTASVEAILRDPAPANAFSSENPYFPPLPIVPKLMPEEIQDEIMRAVPEVLRENEDVVALEPLLTEAVLAVQVCNARPLNICVYAKLLCVIFCWQDIWEDGGSVFDGSQARVESISGPKPSTVLLARAAATCLASADSRSLLCMGALSVTSIVDRAAQVLEAAHVKSRVQ